MKLFISHSSKDKKIGELLVNLFRDIGLNNNQIIFTSLEGFGIEKGADIFEWLKGQLAEKPYVVYLLSPNYYKSIACLNEMGAAWMVESEHIFLFTPEFDLKSEEFYSGAINPRKMGVNLDDKEALLSYFDEFTMKLGLPIKTAILNRAVENFIENLNQIPKTTSDEIVTSSREPDIKIEEDNDDNLLFREIRKGKLTNEELLIVAYLNNIGKEKLFWGWQESKETENIEEWENIYELNDKLSKSYSKVISRLNIRKIIEPSDYTGFDSVKEYSLIESVKNDILNPPEDIMVILKKAIQENTGDDDLPF